MYQYNNIHINWIIDKPLKNRRTLSNWRRLSDSLLCNKPKNCCQSQSFWESNSSPLEILGFPVKFFWCYHLLSNVIICYHLLFFAIICYFFTSSEATALTAAADHLVPLCSAPSWAPYLSLSLPRLHSHLHTHIPTPETHHARDAISWLPIGKLQLEEGRIATIAIAIAGGVEITGNVANSVGVGTILITSNWNTDTTINHLDEHSNYSTFCKDTNSSIIDWSDGRCHPAPEVVTVTVVVSLDSI